MSARSRLIVVTALVAALTAGADQRVPPRNVVDRLGDPLPEHALLRIGTSRLRPQSTVSGRIHQMVFSADRKRLLLVAEYAGVQVWDLETGRKLRQFGKPARTGSEVFALSADGSRAAVVESESVCRFFDTATGKAISASEDDWYLHQIGFSPDGKLLAARHRRSTAIWDVATARKLWEVPIPENSRFGAFAFVSNSAIAIFAPRAGVQVPADPMEERRYPLLLYDIAKGPASERASPIEVASLRNFAFSPDGKLLAAESWRSEFALWDLANGKTLHEPKTVDDTVWCLCFSPDGKRIATGSNHGRVRLWDVASGKRLREHQGFDETVMSVVFTPDCKRVAASSSDDTFRIWDIESGEDAFNPEGHRMRNVQPRFSRDGKTIVSICGFNPTSSRSADERTFRFWDASTGKSLKQLALDRKDFLPLCLSGDANTLFVVDGGIVRRRFDSEEQETIVGLSSTFYRYRCSADGRYLAGHTNDFWSHDRNDLVTTNTLKVVDTISGKEMLAFQGKRGEQFRCWFADDRHLAVHSYCYETDGQKGFRSGMELKESYLTIWDVRSGRKTTDARLLPETWEKDEFRWPGGETLSPARDLAITRGKTKVELRNLATNAKIEEFPTDGWESESWAFSADGKFIAIGTEKGSILLYGVSPKGAAPRLLTSLMGHSAAVTSVQFSADGNRIVSGSDDTTILVWDARPWTDSAK